MVARDPEKDPRGLLGELLRLARHQSSYKTQDALGQAIRLERTGVVRTEQGERVPHLVVLGDWLTQTGVTGLAEAAIRGVWKLALSASDDGPVRIWFVGWVDAEGKAHTLRYWQPLIVPGIVQTPQYAYEIYRGGGRSHARANEEVDARMARQAILDREDAPTIVIVLDEQVLHKMIGSAALMRGQLEKLLEVSERPGVLVHVLPSELGANAGLGGPVSLASVTDSRDVLLTSSLIEDVVTSDVQQVRAASATFETVRGNALSVIESRRTLTEALETWNGK